MALLALAPFYAGCGASDGEASSTETTAESQSTDDTAAATDELFDNDFAQVCRDTGQPRAAEYVAGPGVHPILVLASENGTDFMQYSGTLPEGWSAVWPDLERTELVGCIVQTSATPVEVCEGYEDDDSGLTWTVQTHSVTYDYAVRNARSGEVLARSTFQVPAGACPMFSMYSEGDPQPDPYYPNISDGEAEVFVRPLVTGS